ncbi:protein mono-ADP-ribosyltransferase PARP15-like [Petaurus breviceps papuanus]|uniref:protein mono-ADP-ribosyltransferase PARP15-like n=1 Tax=Petaurus breviceps papuanus TaxID=3040969 RepID=UPI0036D9AC49
MAPRLTIPDLALIATGGAAYSPPSWVGVSESCSGLEKKPENYFQSPRKSGGAECKVKAGLHEGTFWVEFLETAAAAWGKGALYWAKNTPSKPDTNWKKYLYNVRVLTVDYILGNSSFIVPPPKEPQDALVLDDGVIDHKKNLSLYVVFYNHQSYPESLITFRT